MFASPGLDDAVALGPAPAPDARLTHAGLTHDIGLTHEDGLTHDVGLASDDGLTPEGATSTGRAPLHNTSVFFCDGSFKFLQGNSSDDQARIISIADHPVECLEPTVRVVRMR